MSAVERLNQLTRQSAHTAARLRFGRRGTAALRSQGGQVAVAGWQCPRPPRWGALCTRGDGQGHATSRSAATSRPVKITATATLSGARDGCASVPRWSGGGGGQAVSMAARLGGAVHPWRRPGPRGEPKRGHLASCEAHRHRHPLRGARGGCASVPRWSDGGGGQAVSMAARLGRALHPWPRPGPRGEPKRGHLAFLEDHRRCTAAATPERCAHGCASARGWSGGGGGLALLCPCVSLRFPCTRVPSLASLSF